MIEIFRGRLFLIYRAAHVAGCGPYSLHCLAYVSWLGICATYSCADPAQPLTTAGEELDGLQYL